MATKKPTPEQELAQKRARVIENHKAAIERCLSENIGNKLTSAVGTGIYATCSQVIDSLLKELESGNGN